MNPRIWIAPLAAVAVLLASGCGDDDKRAERGELIPRLAESGLTIKYRSVRAPEGLPVLESVVGEARHGDGPVVGFALVAWEQAFSDRQWRPIVVGAVPAGGIGNVEIALPKNVPHSVSEKIRNAVRETMPEAK